MINNVRLSDFDATCIECAEAKMGDRRQNATVLDATCIECAEAKHVAVPPVFGSVGCNLYRVC